ncbi:hypothetical protein RclHR1_39020001 [Rhizophagus clarus]|uniref:Uncharacterized protein n=1 Tax=Rhizophagus clarus TaxID=94130 RepID=A0A2Z6RDG9_9GLOM|nr:hypothetical protein RclHR1_39020001 [Rhizophagus clarus]
MPPSLGGIRYRTFKSNKTATQITVGDLEIKKEGIVSHVMYLSPVVAASVDETKMTRRRKGLQHMIFTQDSILDDCHPENITREVFIKDCEKAVNTTEVHSDEWSTEDEVLANEERNDNIRLRRLKESYFERTRSEWIEPESDDDDDDENNDDDNNDDDNNGNDNNNDDDNNGNDDNNIDGNNGNADKNDGTNEEQNDDNNGNLDVDEHQGPFYLEVPVDIRRCT